MVSHLWFAPSMLLCHCYASMINHYSIFTGEGIQPKKEEKRKEEQKEKEEKK